MTMPNKSHALARGEIVHALTAYSGWTKFDGTPAGDTIVDTDLIGSNNFITGKTILITSGLSVFETCNAVAFDPLTGIITVSPPFSSQILAGTLYKIVNFITGAAFSALIAALFQLTRFTQYNAPGVPADGVWPVVLYDGSTMAYPTKICGFRCTKTGVAWAGHSVLWIEDGAGNKIFPFQANYVEGTDFLDGNQVVFSFQVVVPVASGFKVMFASDDAGDNAGQTLDLDNLDVIEVG